MDGNGGMNFDPMTGEPLNKAAAVPGAAPAPEAVTPAPEQSVYTQPAPQPVYQQPVYAQPVQPVYVQPVYTQPVQQPVYTQEPENKVVYPGKEIIGLVFGVFSLIHGLVGLYTLFPVYGWIAGGINAVLAIIYAIVAKSMWGTIKKNATSFTGKIKAGNGMATAGLVLAIVSIVGAIIIGVIFIVIIAVGGGASVLSSYMSNLNTP